MFIDRPEVHNNTMIKHASHITYTHTTYTVILKYININLKKPSNNPNTYKQIYTK